MTGCGVLACKNRRNQGFRLFRIPTGESNLERRLKWLTLIKRPNLPTHARICEAHFSDEQFESHRQDGKRKLKPNAIPDLLKTRKKMVYSTTTSAVIKTEVNSDETQLTNQPPESIEEIKIIVDPLKISDDRDEIEEEVASIGSANELRLHLKVALRKCRQYEQRLNQIQSKSNLEKIFSPDQLKFLETNNCRGCTWSDETFAKALKLYVSCGLKGYEEVLKQNLPYPSVRTIQHRLKNLKAQIGVDDKNYIIDKLLERDQES